MHALLRRRVADSALMPYSLILWAIASMAAFVYGVGVGRYEWPPFRFIAELRASKLVSDPLSPSQEARLSVFRSTPGTFDVIMLGDSITEGGNWSELFPGVRIANRGMASDTSINILARLHEVAARAPKLVFLM